MPYNGNGVFLPVSLPGSFNPAVSGQQATPTDWNTLLADLVSGFNTALTRDGQTTITANIPFSNFKITGLGSGTALTDAATLGQIQNNGTNYAPDTGTADAYAIAPAPALVSYTVGQEFVFKVLNTNLTTTPTLAVSGLTAGTIVWPDGSALVAGDLPAGADVFVSCAAVSTGTPTWQLQTVRAGPVYLTGAQTVVGDKTFSGATNLVQSLAGTTVCGYLYGLTLSTAGGSGTFGIAAGVAANSTNARMMGLPSAYTKTTSAWAVGSGNGGLDTGTIANSTSYHVYVIERVDTSVVDVVFSLSATSPTLPTNYTLFRRVGSMRTDSSGNWVAFIQDGDYFSLVTLGQDVNANAPGLSATTRTLTSIPTGIRVLAHTQSMLVNNSGSTGAFLYISDLATTNSVPTVSSIQDGTNAATAAGNAQTTSSRISVWSPS